MQNILEKILSKKYYLAIGVLILLIIMMISNVLSKKQSSKTVEEKAGYERIRDIEGITFDVNQNFIDKATAVTEVSNNVEFQKNQYYLYKNGVDTFLLFNMDELVVAAQKGTSFYFNETSNIENALNDSSVVNIWCEKGTKKFECENNANKYIIPVLAGVPINVNLYGDFCGKLAVIEGNDEEWSLFVGVPGERYDKLSSNSKKGIEAIINSFTQSTESVAETSDIYAVEVNGNDPTIQKVAEEEIKVEEIVTPISETKEPTIEEIVEGTQVIEEIPKEEQEKIEKQTSVSLTNQKQVEKKDTTKAYTSTVYKMLNIGDNGILSAINYDTSEIELPIISIKNVYRGDEAEKIIKDFYSSGKAVYNYFEAPEGCHWEAVKYDLNYRDCSENIYVDIRVIGFDGNKLKYRGVGYPMRTYNAIHQVIQDGNWKRGYYAFYAIPNGCTEYALMCGDYIKDSGAFPAYYRIKE